MWMCLSTSSQHRARLADRSGTARSAKTIGRPSTLLHESRQCEFRDRVTYYKTVNTRRHRLKQPKFVLRCTQLQVGLPHAIGNRDRVTRTVTCTPWCVSYDLCRL